MQEKHQAIRILNRIEEPAHRQQQKSSIGTHIPGWKICAKSDDYSPKAFILYYGENGKEFLPKSQVQFISNYYGEQAYGSGIAARWYAVPSWLAAKLQGKAYYKISQ